jgi:ABC-type dipeptide/oligopeptide/nickel transport system ATPase component
MSTQPNVKDNDLDFTVATKEGRPLKMAIAGGPGSGKTFTALTIGTLMSPGSVAVIDTENRSADDYANKFEFSRICLTEFNPGTITKLVMKAVERGFKFLIVDSLSHFYNGKGGSLDIVSSLSKNKGEMGSFGAWRDVNPLEQSMMGAIMASPLHVICTMRSDIQYEVVLGKNGKPEPVKIGLKPQQRKGVEYEFPIFAEMTADNTITFPKTRCTELSGREFNKPGPELVKILENWLTPMSESDRLAAIDKMRESALVRSHVSTINQNSLPQAISDQQLSEMTALMKKIWPADNPTGSTSRKRKSICRKRRARPLALNSTMLRVRVISRN